MGTARAGCLGAGSESAFSRGNSRDITKSRRTLRPDDACLGVVAALGVALVALEQLHPLAFSAPTLRAVIETGITFCALVAGGLFGVSFVHRRRVRDLLLMGALVEIAVVDLVSNVLPGTLDPDALRSLTAGPTVGGVVMGVALLAASLSTAEGNARSIRSPVLLTAGAGILAAGLVELAGWLLHGELGVGGIPPRYGLAGALHHPLGAWLVLAAAGILVAATISAARRRDGIEIATILGAAGVLFALGCLNYLVVPTAGTGSVTAGEILRLAAVVLMLVAGVQQEAAIRGTIAQAAAAEERRRIARDLHDGLAQDLAFIAAHGDRIASEAGEDHPIAIAARRALAVSRGAIADLSASSAPTAQDALRHVADEHELRFAVRIRVEADEAELSPQAREDVVRIAREAIVNATKGHARNIVVTLGHDGNRFVLRVLDDGSGIGATDLKTHLGFGLRSIAERAASLGGGLTARQPASGGTELEVVF